VCSDWFSHGPGDRENSPWELPLTADDDWPQEQRPMTILRTKLDHTRRLDDNHSPPTYVNTETHWWDASQIYGSDGAYQGRARSGVDDPPATLRSLSVGTQGQAEEMVRSGRDGDAGGHARRPGEKGDSQPVRWIGGVELLVAD
jgi:hypothetical protein